jgi:hypothetical protein
VLQQTIHFEIYRLAINDTVISFTHYGPVYIYICYAFSGNGSWVPPPYMNHPIFSDPRENSFKPDEKNVWLFNILKDPNERVDLSETNPDKLKEMLDRLAQYEKTAVPCRYPDNDKRADPKYLGGFWGPWE